MEMSLCMIVKNEEAFIGESLQSAKDVLGLSDLVVVDTGSADGTKKIAEANGARVFDFIWNDDFSAARNFAAGKAKYDWVFVLDADETVKETDIDRISEMLADPDVIGSVIRIEEADKSHCSIARLYNRKHFGFEEIIHEQIRPLEKNAKYRDADFPVTLSHFGNVAWGKNMKEKLERNERLLLTVLGKNPKNPYILYQLGKRFFAMKNDLHKACEYFKKALVLRPDIQAGYVYDLVECYGYALVNTGQYGEAMKLADKYKTHYDVHPQFRFLRAIIYQNNGMLVEAVECFESCVGAEGRDYKGITSFLSCYNIGVICECVGMAEEARRMYEKCGDYEPAVSRLKTM